MAAGNHYFKVTLYFGKKEYTSYRYGNGQFVALSKAIDAAKIKGLKQPDEHRVIKIKPEQIIRMLNESAANKTNS